MKNDLEKQLVETYPKLYRQYHLTVQESCMPWGFECPDDWFDIIDTLSKKLTDLMEREGVIIEACQVKEKLGSFRFYIDTKDGDNTIKKETIDEAYNLIDAAGREVAMLNYQRAS